MAEYAEKFNCGERRKINPAFKKKWMSAVEKSKGSKETSPK